MPQPGVGKDSAASNLRGISPPGFLRPVAMEWTPPPPGTNVRRMRRTHTVCALPTRPILAPGSGGVYSIKLGFGGDRR